MLRKYIRLIKIKLIRQIQKELNANKIALAIAWGLFLGVIPFFCGINIALCILVCRVFRLNHVLMQLVRGTKQIVPFNTTRQNT